MLRAKIKISGEKPKIDIILDKMPIIDYKYNRVGENLFLDIILNNVEQLTEVIRRLKPKKDRKNTKVDLISKEETIGRSFTYVKEKIRTKNIGWQSKLFKKGYTYYLSVNKVIVIGNGLNKGMMIYCYEAEDENGRPIMIAYLDGLPKEPAKEIDITSYNTFIEQQQDFVKKHLKRPSYAIKQNREEFFE